MVVTELKGRSRRCRGSCGRGKKRCKPDHAIHALTFAFVTIAAPASPPADYRSMITIHKAGRWQARLALSLAVYGTTACSPSPRLLRFEDGTEVFYLSNTSVQSAASYPRSRELKIDGEAFVRAAADEKPLVIRTRLMMLTVTGASALRVIARSNETGEEADVLYGHVEARKAYPSRQNEPDTLLAGEEVMVNETIDLQEKETADLPSLRSWSDALMASVARMSSR